MKDERNILPPEAPEPARWPWIVGALVAALVWWVWSASNDPENQAKSRARDAISLCWDEQAKKSPAPAEARFVAGACEGMEADFVQKYGVRP